MSRVYSAKSSADKIANQCYISFVALITMKQRRLALIQGKEKSEALLFAHVCRVQRT